jgi:NitT/TauT family transport system substrate-binding protein
MGRITLLLIGVLGALLGSKAPSVAQTKVVIGLPVGNYAPFVPVYAARDLGLFTKNGVNVEITAFRGGAVAQQALTSGAVDIIDNAPYSAALAIQKGVKQKIIGPSVLTLKGWDIMVLPDSPIKAVKDLAGKNVAITAAGGLTDFYFRYAIHEAGVTANAIPVGGGGLVPALEGKRVDASTMHPPLPFELTLNKKGRSIFNIEAGVPANTPDVWVARQELIDKDPKAVAAVLRSIYQAVDYMKAHREEGLNFFKKYAGDTEDKVVEWEQDQLLPTLPSAAKLDKKMLQNSIDLAKFGGFNDLPSVDEIYTDAFASVQ